MRSGKLDAAGVNDLLHLLAEPSPASQVGTVLKAFRARGVPFEQAWGTAMRTLSRGAPDSAEWRDSFHESKEAWRRAYDAQSVPDTPPVGSFA